MLKIYLIVILNVFSRLFLSTIVRISKLIKSLKVI